MRPAIFSGSKTIEIGPTVRSRRAVDYQEVARPVAAMADEYPPGHATVWHAHRRSQLFYGSSGVTRVATKDGTWIAPPLRAIWVPGEIEHQVICRGPVSFRTLYIDPGVSARLPTECRVLEVSDLLRALIIESVSIPLDYDIEGRDGYLVKLILHEIESAPVSPLHIRMPHSRNLRKMCDRILKDPSINADLDYWSEKTGMSRRTLTRHFRMETGMSVATWLKQARLVEALSRLAEGASVTTVAFEVGYESSSAFGAMFRRTFGCSPTRY